MNPQKTILAIDLHGVLFKHDYKRMFKTYWQSKHKLKLILALINPLLWVDVIRLMRQNAIAEQFLVGLAEKHHRLKPFVHLGIHIANQQKPIQKVVDMLEHLKNKGYTLHLFSNIGSITFEEIWKKFPSIFQLFDSFILPSQSNNYLRKPNPIAFATYLRENNKENKQVVLIDDKRKNVRQAKNHGIKSIWFQSPEHLQQQLLTMGIKTF